MQFSEPKLELDVTSPN